MEETFQEFINHLRLDADIVSVISDYIVLQKRGRSYWGCCPFHQEKTASFSVTPDKGLFYCFGCHKGGNIFNFLMEVENISFVESVKFLAHKMNISMPEKEKSPLDKAKEKELTDLYRVNKLAVEFFSACLTKTGYGKPALEYLTARGITKEIIRDFQIGFAPPAWDKLYTSFLAKGINPELMLKAGLIVNSSSRDGFYDRFRNRIIIPIANARGKTVGFGGRVIDGSQPKYLNTSETIVFNKRRLLFAMHRAHSAIKESGKAIVVEGYMDAIALHAAGITNAVASLGTAFSLEQAKQIKHYADQIIFAYDSDTAGQNATLKALSVVKNLDINIQVLMLPDGKDPDEFLRGHGPDEFKQIINNAASLTEYHFQRALQEIDYSTLEGKVAVVSRMLPVLAEINAVEADEYITKIAKTISIDEEAVRTEYYKFLKRSQKDKTVNRGQTRYRTIINKLSSATENAVCHLIRLMCEDNSLIPYVQSFLSGEEFADDIKHNIFMNIYDYYQKYSLVEATALVSVLEADAAAELSRILLLDTEYEDIPQLVDDCIKTIRLDYLKKIYAKHCAKADELQRIGDSGFLQELMESHRIQDEINKLRQ